MRRKTVAALLAVLSVCVLAACASGPQDGDSPAADMAASDVPAADGDISWRGDPALDFTAEMADGTSFSLSEQTGQDGDSPAADMAASGEALSADNSSPEETPDAVASDVPAADGDISWQGDPALDFTAEMADGTSFTLSEQTGKVVLVNFWATWCGPCVHELPDIAELYGEYAAGDEAEIILVNCGESAEVVRSFLERNGYALPVAYDADGAISDAYGVNAIPRTVVFGKDGTVAADYVGSRDYDTFKSAIDGALGG